MRGAFQSELHERGAFWLDSKLCGLTAEDLGARISPSAALSCSPVAFWFRFVCVRFLTNKQGWLTAKCSTRRLPVSFQESTEQNQDPDNSPPPPACALHRILRLIGFCLKQTCCMYGFWNQNPQTSRAGVMAFVTSNHHLIYTHIPLL